MRCRQRAMREAQRARPAAGEEADPGCGFRSPAACTARGTCVLWFGGRQVVRLQHMCRRDGGGHPLHPAALRADTNVASTANGAPTEACR